jgi:hypothetical protein
MAADMPIHLRSNKTVCESIRLRQATALDCQRLYFAERVTAFGSRSAHFAEV